MQLTITEALAEVKTLSKRVAAKRDFIKQYLVRQDQFKDPLEKSGGSVKALIEARQSVNDLYKRVVAIRTAIQAANLTNKVKVGDATMTVAEWLTWKKDVAPSSLQFLKEISKNILTVRQQAQAKGVAVVGAGATQLNPTDVIVNVDETELAQLIEVTETTLGTLDGRLSLFNATTTIEVD